MDTFVERHGPCSITVSERRLTNGRRVLLFKATGTCSSSDFSICLDGIARRRVFERDLMTILDNRCVQRETDADGLFRQAQVFARSRVRRLRVCYVSDTESTAAIAPLVREVFGRAGVTTDIHICRNLEDALDWMNASVDATDDGRGTA